MSVWQRKPSINAKRLRKSKGHIEREECFVCGKHKEITQLHHIMPLQECAQWLEYVKGIEVPRVWLCPNCHAYVHLWLSGKTIQLANASLNEKNFTYIELKKMSLVAKKNADLEEELYQRVMENEDITQ